MSTENKIVGSITVSAQFEKDWRTYDAEVVFNLHEDGQKSLRSQSVNDGRHIIYDQDFQEEAYALMHAHDTRELQIEVEQLKRENAALRALAHSAASCLRNIGTPYCTATQSLPEAGLRSYARMQAETVFAALSPQEAARG